MIIIYEPWASDEMHYQFNKNFIDTIKLVENSNIIYCGEKQQIELLKKEITLIQFKEMNICNYSNNRNKIFKILNELKNILLLCLKSSSVIYITTGLPQTILFSKFFLKKRKVFYVMHGQLEYIEKKLKWYNMFFYTKISLLKWNNPNHKFIILGESIKKNLIKILPEIESYVVTMDHPYSSLCQNKVSILNKDLINIGTIGVTSEKKGSLTLNRISDFLKYNDLENIKLFHVGKKSEEIIFNSNIKVPFIGRKGLIPKEEFRDELGKLDFYLYLFPIDSYRLIASGSLFDAMADGKPVIALENDYFKYIFEKAGDIGYLCKNIDELNNELMRISKIVGTEEFLEEYNSKQENLRNAIKLFSPEEIALKFKEMEV